EDGPKAIPGKAVVILAIEDDGFKDFREDASCIIRPQSLIGEKFVDCRPTLPRAPGTDPPPPLEQIPDGEDGEGQYLLPLGSNGTSVDPDLINDIQTLPYAQRFRLIFNELGAGFAGRGEDLQELVKRANPVLRDVDRLFGILAAQRDELAQLASDSEAILVPLARERTSVAGFFTNAGAAGQASSERGEDLEESLQKFPTFLREFRTTMTNLGGFFDAARPVFENFDEATPALTEATRTLTPFSEALTTSLKSLGNAGEASGPIFAEADPVVRKAATLAKSGVVPTRELAKLFVDLKTSGGWDGLTELIYNSAAALNGFDTYGHFGRLRVTLSTCLEYIQSPAGYSGCVANFNGPNANASASTSPEAILSLIQQGLAEESGGTAAEDGPVDSIGEAQAPGGQPGLGDAERTAGGTAPLLDYLLGP
ncbi:MAG TPA: hypothetical protein VFX45_06525, partial [Solirubrobacterales bacterium]|nr:hypothetical protein [Solirubrobacterales bacterium]